MRPPFQRISRHIPASVDRAKSEGTLAGRITRGRTQRGKDSNKYSNFSLLSPWGIVLTLCLFSITLFYTILRLTILNFQNTLNFFASDNIFTQNILFRIYTFLSTLPIYLKLIVFPINLQPERTIPIQTSFLNLSVFLGTFIVLLSALLIWKTWKKSPLIAFGILWFYITIFPSSNIIIPINALIAEHWLYTPSIGIFLVISVLISAIYHQINLNPNIEIRNPKQFSKFEFSKIWSFEFVSNFVLRASNLFFILLTCILILLSFRTITQNSIWRDQISLYEYIQTYNPDSARVHNNLGMAYSNKGKNDQAINEYKKAIQLSDTYPQSHHNLARIYAQKGMINEAIAEYKKAITLDPNFLFSYTPLIDLLKKSGRIDEANLYEEKVTPYIKN